MAVMQLKIERRGQLVIFSKRAQGAKTATSTFTIPASAIPTIMPDLVAHYANAKIEAVTNPKSNIMLAKVAGIQGVN